MGDTKRGRDKQARDEEDRQRERELEQELERGDEAEPADEGERGAGAVEVDELPTCHRRGCDEPAAFRVLERYEEDTGHGTVEAVATMCHDHTAEEGPVNLDAAGPDYVFRIDPIPASDA